MEDSVKRRLLGLSVLVLSAAILLPLFLTGEGYRERHLQSQIPSAPTMPDIVDITPETALLVDTSKYPKAVSLANTVTVLVDNNQDTPVIAQEKRPVIGTDNDTPQLDEQSIPVAWTLQLASFKDESNARALRKQLIESGHKVYTRKTADLFKVYVGPDIQRERLDQLKESLQRDYGLDGIIFRFTTQ